MAKRPIRVVLTADWLLTDEFRELMRRIADKGSSASLPPAN